MKELIRAASRCCLAAVAALAFAALSLSAQASRSAPPSKPAAGGQQQGIHVHGHWTIVVKNPDGSVAAREEFENTLQSDGSNLLPLIIGGFATPGAWTIVLQGGFLSNLGPCVSNQTAASDCWIVASNGTYTAPSGHGCAGIANIPSSSCSQNLSVAAHVIPGPSDPTTGLSLPPTVSLNLSGSIVAPAGGTILSVATQIQACSSTGASGSTANAFSFLNTNPSASTADPGACTTGFNNQIYDTAEEPNLWWTFTASPLPTAMQVSPNQILQVTVIISFS